MLACVFDVAGQWFGVGADRVREIHRAVAITRVPDAPACVEGVVNVRGAVLPVVSLRRRFALPYRQILPQDVLIQIQTAHQALLLRADAPLGVVELRPEPLSALAAGAALVVAAAGTADGLVLIQDVDALLASDEVTELAAALARWRDGTGP